MTRRRMLPLAILLALVPAAAGCGGGDDGKDKSTSAATSTPSSSTTAYKSQVQTILASVGAAGSQLGAAAQSSKSGKDIAAALQSFKTSVAEAADKLGQLDAPSAAQQGQDELEKVLREISDGVQPSIDAARANNRAKFAATFKAYQAKLNGEFRQRLTAAGGQIDQAVSGQ